MCAVIIFFVETVDNFKNCSIGSPDFDGCVLTGLNSIQKFFSTGKLLNYISVN
jgi:hypothetical protein